MAQESPLSEDTRKGEVRWRYAKRYKRWESIPTEMWSKRCLGDKGLWTLNVGSRSLMTWDENRDQVQAVMEAILWQQADSDGT